MTGKMDFFLKYHPTSQTCIVSKSHHLPISTLDTFYISGQTWLLGQRRKLGCRFLSSRYLPLILFCLLVIGFWFHDDIVFVFVASCIPVWDAAPNRDATPCEEHTNVASRYPSQRTPHRFLSCTTLCQVERRLTSLFIIIAQWMFPSRTLPMFQVALSNVYRKK